MIGADQAGGADRLVEEEGVVQVRPLDRADAPGVVNFGGLESGVGRELQLDVRTAEIGELKNIHRILRGLLAPVFDMVNGLFVQLGQGDAKERIAQAAGHRQFLLFPAGGLVDQGDVARGGSLKLGEDGEGAAFFHAGIPRGDFEAGNYARENGGGAAG